MTARIRQQPRRYGFAVLLLAVAVTAVFFAVRPGGRALATSDGSPYAVTYATDTNPDPNVFETTLTAEDATVDIGNGVMANAETFNGEIPGPTFQLKVGDTVIVHYVNDLSQPSAIHWHGIELENSMDGTPFVQNPVPPGGKFLYKFKVTRPGIFWYHPHLHASTDQVFKGLYGMILVTDPNEAALQADDTLPSPAQTYPIVLSDTTVCKAVGHNDAATYDPSLPWVGGGPLPAQPSPTPKDLCETSPIDENGNPRGAFSAGDIPNIETAATSGRTNEGQTVLTNGVNVGGRAGSPDAPGALDAGASTLDVQAGQGIRLEVLNAATVRYMRLRLTDNSGTLVPLYQVGGEGGLLDNAVRQGGTPGGFDTGYSSGEILIPPGSRVDMVAAIPASATGVLTMWTEDYSRTGMGFPDLPTVPVMHLQVTGTVSGSPYTISDGTPLRAATGDPVQAYGAPTATLLDPSTFTHPKLGMSSQDIKLTQTGTALGIDGVFGTHDISGDYTAAPHLGSTRYATLGDVLELSVTNTTTGAHHPFHLHGFSMQPISLTKSGSPSYIWPYTEFRDNIDIPPGYTLTFKIKITDRPLADGVTMGGAYGRWLFHCHIFFHATNGMLGELVIVQPDGNEKPDVNANDVSVDAHHGDTVTEHGTYSDPDGDPVTLSASIGTVSDDGGGHWTWTYTTTGTDSSQFVYVTATDPGGLKDQAVFQLNIINTPPTLHLPGPQTQEFHHALSFGVSATDPDVGDTVSLGASGLPAALGFTDNGDRTGTVSGTITADPGTYPVTFSANDHVNAPVTAPLTITVTREATTTAYTGVTGPVLFGSTVTLAGVLKEDTTAPIAGQLLTMTLGSGAAAQHCTATTNASGSASCPIVVNQPVGTQPVSASFAGNTDYVPSSAANTVKVYTALSLKQDVLATAQSLYASADKHDSDKLKDIVSKLTDAVDPSRWGADGNHLLPQHGDEDFDREKDAVGGFQDMISDHNTAIPAATLQPLIDMLVHADQILATVAIADATAAGGDPNHLADAQKELAAAAQSLAQGDPHNAMDHFKNAWHHAEESVHAI